jgi:acetyl-CoA carboxylase biotin carboxyl carrier protein
MDIQRIEQLAALMQRFGLQKLEIEEGETSIKLGMPRADVPEYLSHGAPRLVHSIAPAAFPQPVHSPAPHAPRPEEAAAAPAPAVRSGHKVKSPLVGTFYRSSSPGGDPFTEVGKRVKKGDALCIIEAMKMMNQIDADKDGVIVEILVANEQPVEFDQPLFIIEP